MTTIAVIPARFESSRFPGKPLANQTGKFLIQHVYEGILQAQSIDRVVVATDDARIFDAVKSFGGDVKMTSIAHANGTSRVAEVADEADLTSRDLVINVQGDEPELEPDILDNLVNAMGRSDTAIGTLAARFPSDGPKSGSGSPADPQCVKVVMDGTGHALYFSRCPIPYTRAADGLVDEPSNWLLHLGVYAYRPQTLQKLVGGKPTQLEQREGLEQLRWLHDGHRIHVHEVERHFAGIDTPEDYEGFVERFRRKQSPVAGRP